MNVILDKNYGIDKDEIRNAVDYMKSEYEEEHERDIKKMIRDDDYKSPWKNKDATVATGLITITYSSFSYKKPAARKEPIKVPHLGKLFRDSMDEPTDMDPVFTGIGIIVQGGSWNISGGSHTQSIVQGGEKNNSQ